MSVAERLAKALADLDSRWGGRRRPKAFYLVAEDWAEFVATNPPSVRAPWGNNPTTWADEPGFNGVPVRESTARTNRLYDHTGSGRAI